jgi:hypothetical protein
MSQTENESKYVTSGSNLEVIDYYANDSTGPVFVVNLARVLTNTKRNGCQRLGVQN